MGFGEENRALSGTVHAVVRYPIITMSSWWQPSKIGSRTEFEILKEL